MIGKDEPLSEPAITYLQNQQTWKEYIAELIKHSRAIEKAVTPTPTHIRGGKFR